MPRLLPGVLVAALVAMTGCSDDTPDDGADGATPPASETAEASSSETLTWSDPEGDAVSATGEAAPNADIVSSSVEVISTTTYRVSIEVAGVPDADHKYRFGAHVPNDCDVFHILDTAGAVAKVNAFCGLPGQRELQSSHDGGLVEVTGNRITATFPRTGLPEFVDANRVMTAMYSYSCELEGDCNRFVDDARSAEQFAV